jgi:hypothetical protein
MKHLRSATHSVRANVLIRIGQKGCPSTKTLSKTCFSGITIIFQCYYRLHKNFSREYIYLGGIKSDVFIIPNLSRIILGEISADAADQFESSLFRMKGNY